MLLAQAAALAVAMHRGWYYNDDFALLMNASHRSLGWNYLKTPINDHLLPGVRLEFWLLRHTVPLNYTLTIVIRLLMQLASTVLLFQLLTMLAGRRRRVLLTVGLYALCPLVLTNSLWLTVALSLLPAQAFVLAALVSHVRATVTGQWRWAAASGLCLLGGALFWEKVAVSAVILPILSLGYLYGGSLRQRVAATLRAWKAWLLAASPIALFTTYFVLAGYGGATRQVSASDLVGVWWMQWSRVVSPSLFGGPWTWFDQPNVSLGYAQIPRAALVLTQVGFALVVCAGLRLVGLRSLIAWTIPGLPLILGTTLVAFGRFAFFGQLIATTLRYGADLAAPLFIGLALAIIPTSAEAIRRRVAAAAVVAPVTRQDLEAAPVPPSASALPPSAPALPPSAPALAPARARGSLVTVGVLALVGWLVGSLVSVNHFARHWGSNPAHHYVRALTANIDRAGPALNLYDTTVSQTVLPIFFGPRWHMSDFLPLTGHVPTLDAPATEPLLADDVGALVPAVLVPAAIKTPPPGGLCAYLIQGAAISRVPFDVPAPEGDGFLRLDYLQQRPSTADIWIEDAYGVVRPPIDNPHVVFAYQLSHVTLRLPMTSVAAVIIRTGAPETHLCLGRLTVGAPFPVGGSR